MKLAARLGPATAEAAEARRIWEDAIEAAAGRPGADDMPIIFRRLFGCGVQ